MASEGPVSLSTWSDDTSPGTGIDWIGHGNVAAADGAYAGAPVAGAPPTYFTVQLVVGGAVVGDNLAAGEAFTADDGSYTAFGGPTNTAGLVLRGADVTAADFGVVIQARGPNAQSTSNYLKGLGAAFSQIGAADVVTGVVVEVLDDLGAFGEAKIDHVRLTVTYVPAPLFGLYGPFDFTGIPVGVGQPAPARRGHGPKIGPDRRMIATLMAQQMARRRAVRYAPAPSRSLLDVVRVETLALGDADRAEHEQTRHRAAVATWSVVLAEI